MSSSAKRTPKKTSTTAGKPATNKSIKINPKQNSSQRPIPSHLICDRSPSLVRRRIEAQKTKNKSVRKFREQIRDIYHQTDGLSSFTQTSVLSVPPEVTSDRYLLGQYKYSTNASSSASEISSQYSQESEKAPELEPETFIRQIQEQIRSQFQTQNLEANSNTSPKKQEKKQIQTKNGLKNQTQKQENDEQEIKIDGSQYVKEPINNDDYEEIQNESENSPIEEEEIESEVDKNEEAPEKTETQQEQNSDENEDKQEQNLDENEDKQEQNLDENEDKQEQNFDENEDKQEQNLDENEDKQEQNFDENEDKQEQNFDENEIQVEEEEVEKDSSIDAENKAKVSNFNENLSGENADDFDENQKQKIKYENFDQIYKESQEENESIDDDKHLSNFDEIYNESQVESEKLGESKNKTGKIFNDLYESLSQPENKNQEEEDSAFNEYDGASPNFAQTANFFNNYDNKNHHLTNKAATFSENQLKGQNNEYEKEGDVDVESQEEEDHEKVQKTERIKLDPLNNLQQKVQDSEENEIEDYNPNARPLVSPRSYKSPFSPHSNLRTKFRLPSNDTSGLDGNLKHSGEQLLEISVRPFLYNLSIKYGEPIRRLRDIPEFEFLDWQSMGFQWVWLYGVWKLGSYCLNFDLTDQKLLARYNSSLPGWNSEDVIGYPLSIVSYDVNPEIGDIDDLIWFREKLKKLNISFMLDFVPNHTAIDASEVLEHPEFYMHSKSENVDENRFIKEKGNIAYGAGVNMPPMKFTAQLNIFSEKARGMQIENLIKISKLCDGVRVHLAHFLLTEQFAKQWKEELKDEKTPSTEFWKDAIDKVRLNSPSFVMMAESYGSENQSQLIECGFNYIYDKELIDHLVAHDVNGFRDLIFKNHFITDKMVHFVENHDEPRMIHRFGENSKAAMTASVALLTLPGIRLFNMQQWLGYRTQIDVNLRRAPHEECNQEIVRFYTKLFHILESRALLYGKWKPMPVIDDAGDRIVAWKWVMDDQHILVTFNFNNQWSQGRIICDDANIDSMKIYVLEMISDTYYTRNPYELREKGLVLSMEPYQAQVFEY